MIDVATFKGAFPEFNDAPPELVTAKLAYALALVPIAVWGALQEQGAFQYTARFLALSPFGRKIGLVTKTGTTIYDEDLQRLKRTVTAGFRSL